MSIFSNKIGVNVPDILLPSKDIDHSKWAVVACDQYTSQPEYWEKVEKFIDGSPSTLHITFPEVYLEDGDMDSRISSINENMQKYLGSNVLVNHNSCFIYVDRKTSHAESRKGLIVSLDLEHYDYNRGAQTLVRATEGTVIERLPPRIKIRENASIELPHIMVLIDDPHKTVIEPLSEKASNLDKLYDFDLMMGGEHITGFKINNPDTIQQILSALQNLAAPDTFKSKYGVGDDKGVLLFAVGDGNHSLASAKAHWENVKKTLTENEVEDHPARYALVEIVNVHDEGLEFEPIHRVVFNVSASELLDSLLVYFNSKGCMASYEADRKTEAAIPSTAQIIPFITSDMKGAIKIEKPFHTLAVGSLQCFLDEYMKDHPDMKIDYIHGADVVDSLGSKKGNIGFLLPAMDKNDLFRTVIVDGVLPRKTFSMGEAEEKRFYLECRKICR